MTDPVESLKAVIEKRKRDEKREWRTNIVLAGISLALVLAGIYIGAVTF